MWLIEPTFAEMHLPLINSYLAGEFSPKLLEDDEDDQQESESDRLSRAGYAVAANNDGNGSQSPQTRFALDDPELPDGSVFVLDIRGAIFKESSCCAIGTEEYCGLLDQAYANEKIIGIVCLVDSPGGQLSGTPTLYDAIRNPAKPTVSVINEGMMASAAYWLACGSDEIYATQKSDQVGSIGVYVTFDDSSERKKQMGIVTHTIYSDRSSEKNLPYRQALAGNDQPMKEDLNYAADLFRGAVEEGRGAKLKPVKKGGADVFKGGLFYASQAIDLGLIDGFGNLTTAVNRVVELHSQRQTPKTDSAAPRSGFAAKPAASQQSAVVVTEITQETPAPAQEPTITDAPEASTDAPDLSAIQPDSPQTVESEATQSPTPNPNQSMNSIFGFTRIGALSAIAGVAADQITQEQIDAINAEFQTQNFNVAVISQAQFAEIQQLQGQLNTAQNTIVARDAEIARLGKQPGATPTRVEKIEESVAPQEAETNSFLSETDAINAQNKARIKGQAA